jgi:hypothetical protein
VETLGDLQSANPEYWFPTGTRFDLTPTQIFPDVLEKYFRGSLSGYVAP